MKQEGMYNVRDAAQELQAPRRTVAHWCKTGKLKAFKLGRDYVILAADLEAFKLSRENKE